MRKYEVHRVITANDGTTYPFTFLGGFAASSFHRAVIQVIPIAVPMTVDALNKGALPAPGTSTPIVEVLWWSSILGKFVPGLPAITKTGPGAGTAFEFEIEALGRKFAVRLNSGLTPTEAVVIAVDGFNANDMG